MQVFKCKCKKKLNAGPTNSKQLDRCQSSTLLRDGAPRLSVVANQLPSNSGGET